MSEEETGGTLPPSEPREVDPERLRELLQDALHTSLDILSDTEPSKSLKRPIYRPQEDGFRSEYIVLPSYTLRFDERTENPISSSEAQALLNYLWNHGKLRRPHGPDPTRESWERYVFLDLIRYPLSQILWKAGIDEAVRTGEVTPWRLPDDALERVIDDLVWSIRHGGHRYVARCLLASVEGEPGEVWELGQGVRLRFHTKEERLKHLSQNARNLPLHLGPRNTMWEEHPILEIPRTISQSQLEEGPTETIKDTVSRQVGKAIDLIKWALMAATEQGRPLAEGEIFFECYSKGVNGARINNHQLKRQDTRQSTVYDRFSNKELNTVTELLKHTPNIRRQSDHLDGALWHFGRSCLAPITRDVLLDAVVGLDHLLAGGSSPRYEFRLNGTAILATSADEAEEIEDELKTIWDERSSAVHSFQMKTDLADRARQLLAMAISFVTELVRDGKFEPAQNIPKQIKNKVLREAPFRSGGDA